MKGKLAQSSRKKHIGEKLISNTVYLFLDWFVVAFFSFIFWLVIWKAPAFSPLDVGIVATSINLIVFISGLSTFGIDIALQKLVPEVKERIGIRGVYSLVKLSIKPVSISLLVLLLILLFFSDELSHFIKIPYNAFLISVISIIIVSVYNFLGSILYGLQNMRWCFLTDFFQSLLKVILTGLIIFLLIFYLPKYQGYLYLAPLTGFFLSYFLISFLRFDPNYLKGHPFLSYKKLFFYATPAFISSLAVILINNGQYIILTIIQNAEVTGIFSVASAITTVIGMLAGILVSALFPIISGLSTNKKTKGRQEHLIGLVLRYSLFLMIPLSFLLIVFSRYAVLLFSKPEFLPSTQYFPVLVPAALLFGVGTIFVRNLYAIGKPKLHRNVLSLSALFFLISSLILTYYFSALGLCFSYLMTMLLRFLLGFGYMKRYLKIKFFSKDILKIMGSSLIVTAILFVFKPFVSNVFSLAILLVPFAFLYLFLLFLTKFYIVEDVKLLMYFGGKLPIIGKHLLSMAAFLKNRL